MSSPEHLPVVVLISGAGSNLQALIDAVAQQGLPVDIRAVISNRRDAQGLQRAQRTGIATAILDHRDYADRAAFDAALQALIDGYQPGLVLLAGFMRVLTRTFVAHYQGRMLNIHPSLLPDLPGIDTHRRALASGRTVHGASVHFVTPEVDGGPVIIQARITIAPGDDAASLGARVLAAEHQIYPLAVRWFAAGRLRWCEGQIEFDGRVLSAPLVYDVAQQAVLSC